MKRRAFITLVGGMAAGLLAPHDAIAQPSDRIRQIALLSGFAATDPEAQARVAALHQGLKELGWLEGRNLSIDFRRGTGERDQMRAFARELIELRPDLILGMTTPAMTALVEETKTIPILFVNIVDPLGRGFISNMARPGGNVTGFLNFEFSMGGKWLETLKQMAPAVRRVALLFNPHTAPYANSFMRVAEAGAPSFGVEPIAAGVHDDGELERTVADFAAKPAGGLIILPDAFTAGHRDLIIALAARFRLPAIYPLRVFAVSGGLISDGGDSRHLPPRGILRRPGLEGRQSRRSSRAGADQVRTGDQSEDCQRAGTQRAADAARTGRRGDRMRERHLEAKAGRVGQRLIPSSS
jgi:putative tryptophan/tyrosine transport system substrate-binding protein